jgi:NAD+ synthase
MDLILCGKNQGFGPAEVGRAAGLKTEQVERVFRDIEAKRRVAHYLHAAPVLIEKLQTESPLS